jgi:hypothetical protein
MKAKKGAAVKDAEFGECHDWFYRFKKRSNLHNIKVQGEAAAAERGYKMKFLMLIKWGCSET